MKTQWPALAEKKNPIEVPPSLVKNRRRTVIARELAQQMRLYGGALDPDKVIADARAHAEMRVRAGLLLSELAKKFGVTRITDDDIQRKDRGDGEGDRQGCRQGPRRES